MVMLTGAIEPPQKVFALFIVEVNEDVSAAYIGSDPHEECPLACYYVFNEYCKRFNEEHGIPIVESNVYPLETLKDVDYMFMEELYAATLRIVDLQTNVVVEGKDIVTYLEQQ